ncbi:Mth938-like domain-containing protein [Candidatus Bathyarchaeota archaeon]|nr:Mth938-like domain-containing protein [Candidatus Bathyarchaeota archaeon]
MIDSYSFGVIVIDGKRYTADVIILPNKVREGWWRKEGGRLHLEDLQEVLGFKDSIDSLVIGTGHSGIMQVPNEVARELTARNIEVTVEPTKQACKTFNELVKSGRRVAAALHLTC